MTDTATLVNRCLAMSRRIKDGRTIPDIQYKLSEEFGELGQELLIAAGKHYKKPGKDGVIGEALDIIVCCIDMIYNHDKDVTEEQLAVMIQKKLEKWLEKAEQMVPGCSNEAQSFHEELELIEIKGSNAVFGHQDGSLAFMTLEEFQKNAWHLVMGKLKGRFEYNRDGTIRLTHVVFGDLDEARKEYEESCG